MNERDLEKIAREILGSSHPSSPDEQQPNPVLIPGAVRVSLRNNTSGGTTASRSNDDLPQQAGDSNDPSSAEPQNDEDLLRVFLSPDRIHLKDAHDALINAKAPLFQAMAWIRDHPDWISPDDILHTIWCIREQTTSLQGDFAEVLKVLEFLGPGCEPAQSSEDLPQEAEASNGLNSAEPKPNDEDPMREILDSAWTILEKAKDGFLKTRVALDFSAMCRRDDPDKNTEGDILIWRIRRQITSLQGDFADVLEYVQALGPGREPPANDQCLVAFI